MNTLLLATTAVLIPLVVAFSIAVAHLSFNAKTVTQEVSEEILTYTKQIVASKSGTKLDVDTKNICAGEKVDLENIPCFREIVGTIDDADPDFVNDFALGTAEQAGANVTKGYNGLYDTEKEPITDPYFTKGMCPVNVHWHLGAEHLSVGEYDETGKGPETKSKRRNLAGDVRLGNRCHHYDKDDSRYTREYDWKHCVGMHVGETYEVHWPHSGIGDCGTPNQYQTPFYDGVFCHYKTNPDLTRIGVQGQVFTIINDESYYYPDLIRGMIVDGSMGTEVTKYTGSTTGTSRDNKVCSQYTGITWQVDRKCHLISASSFDKMCADMKSQRDDMSEDLHAHGAREVVNSQLAADNFVHKRR